MRVRPGTVDGWVELPEQGRRDSSGDMGKTRRVCEFTGRCVKWEAFSGEGGEKIESAGKSHYQAC